jgi:signal transduction histidine kinase
MKRLRGLSAQVLLFVILPLFLILMAVALGSVIIHQSSMRVIVGERDLKAVRTAAAALSDVAYADSQHIRNLLVELQAGPQMTVMLVDREGRAVYHSDPREIGQLQSHPGVVEALAGRTGILYRPEAQGGGENVVAFAPVPLSEPSGGQPEEGLIVEEPWARVASPWLNLSLAAPLVLMLVVAFAFVALWLGVQRIIQPLQKLNAKVLALGQGDFQAVTLPVGGIEEIRELQRAVARMAGEIHDYQQSIRGYLDAVTTAQEEERKRVARELHDETVQDLVAIKQRVQIARRRPEVNAASLEAEWAELQAMIDTTTDEVRRFTRALRPIYLEEAGLVAALETLARDTNRSTLEVGFRVVGEPQRLPPETELALYRVVQAALTNVVSHARASSADVRVAFSQDALEICVQDDGVGFRPPERVNDLVLEGHYGLMGMQERARLVGAHLAIHSGGEGTLVEVRLPLK